MAHRYCNSGIQGSVPAMGVKHMGVICAQFSHISRLNPEFQHKYLSLLISYVYLHYYIGNHIFSLSNKDVSNEIFQVLSLSNKDVASKFVEYGRVRIPFILKWVGCPYFSTPNGCC